MPPTTIDRLAGRTAATTALEIDGAVIRPILLLPNSVNHTAPSGPPTMPVGRLLNAGNPKSFCVPLVVIRLRLLLDFLGRPRERRPARRRFASGDCCRRELGDHAGGRDAADPVAGALGKPQRVVGRRHDPFRPGAAGRQGNWVITPAVVIRPIALLEELRPKIVNHNAPSGPCVIPVGSWLSAGSGNSATVPPVLIRPIRFAVLGEPQIAVRPGGDPVGLGASRQRKFGDRPARGYPADVIGTVLGEPEIAVGTGGDGDRGVPGR